MTKIQLTNPNIISLDIDVELFSENVIFKTLYWYSGDYIIQSRKENDQITVLLEKKKDEISTTEFNRLKQKISQDLIDYKTREIIESQTRPIRQLLIIKAFATIDDFDGIDFI